MQFVSRLWKTGDSLVITIPNEIVEKLKLKEKDIKEFTIKEE
ncbi:MAG: hypothetical protein AABY22_37070 [Nanoarchaeota archaeon]